MCVLRRSSTCLGDKRNKKGEKNDRLKFYDSSPYHLTCLVSFTEVLTTNKVSLTPLRMSVLFLVSPSSHTSTHFHFYSSLSLPFLQSKPHTCSLSHYTLKPPLNTKNTGRDMKIFYFFHKVCRKMCVRGRKSKRITKKCGKCWMCFSMCVHRGGVIRVRVCMCICF